MADQSEMITILNTAPGVMDVSLIQAPPGIEAKLSKKSLNSGEGEPLSVTAGGSSR